MVIQPIAKFQHFVELNCLISMIIEQVNEAEKKDRQLERISKENEILKDRLAHLAREHHANESASKESTEQYLNPGFQTGSTGWCRRLCDCGFLPADQSANKEICFIKLLLSLFRCYVCS